MVPLQLVVAAMFAAIAGGVAALDATRRGRPWFAPAVAVGVVAFVASLGVVAGEVLLSASAVLNGGAPVVVTPRELVGLTAAAAAVVAVAVLSGYGLLTRLRHPA